MKQNLLLLLLLTTVFSVAAQTDTIAPAKTKAPSYATIYTMEGKKIKGWFYKMDNNNLFLLPSHRKAKQLIANTAMAPDNGSYFIDAAQINTIALKKKNAGLKGALIGLGAGAAIGIIAGFASGDDPVTPPTGYILNDIVISLGNVFAMTAGEKAAAMGIAGGLTGAIIGGITGALLKKKFIIGGNKDNYHNSQAELNKRAMVKF